MSTTAQKFQNSFKDFIKLSSRTEAVDGQKLINLRDKIEGYAANLNLEDLFILQSQAVKQAAKEMNFENKMTQPRKGSSTPKYHTASTRATSPGSW